MSAWEHDDEDVMDGFEPAEVIDTEGVSQSRVVEPPPEAAESRTVRPGVVREAAKLRVRPLSPGMERRYPDVVSILVTRNDGAQVLYHRGLR